jgi:hypothetical protein
MWFGDVLGAPDAVVGRAGPKSKLEHAVGRVFLLGRAQYPFEARGWGFCNQNMEFLSRNVLNPRTIIVHSWVAWWCI